MYVYDIAPGQLVETENPIDEAQLDDARKRYEGGTNLLTIAKRLGGAVFIPAAATVSRVAVDPAELGQLLAERFPDEADRARILEQLTGRATHG